MALADCFSGGNHVLRRAPGLRGHEPADELVVSWLLVGLHDGVLQAQLQVAGARCRGGTTNVSIQITLVRGRRGGGWNQYYCLKHGKQRSGF